MTPKQQAFCDYYVASGNATEAAKKAGYSNKTAYSIGQRLLKNVEVKTFIDNHALKVHNSRIAESERSLGVSLLRKYEMRITAQKTDSKRRNV